MTKDQLKAQIDIAITNKTSAKSISPINVGGNMKNIIDLIPTPDGSETKIVAGENVTVTGEGTIAVPYIVNSIDSRPYKEFTCLITQDGINPPIITVLDNDFSDITFITTYNGVGEFKIIPSTPFGDYRKMILTFPTSVGATNSGVICDFNSLFDDIDFRVTEFSFSSFIYFVQNSTILKQSTDGIVGLYPFSVKMYN